MPPKPRTPAKRPAKAAPTVEQANRFEAFAARARASSLEMVSHRAPVVLAAFDPPITATYPASLAGRIELDEAIGAMRLTIVLRILLGEAQFLRVVREFDKEPEADRLLMGLVLHLIDKFHGAGAADVPGGSQAS